MKKIISLLLAAIMTLGCLAGVCFAAEPIAQVINGSEITEVYDIAEMKVFINPDGTTKIKMLKDFVTDGTGLTNIPTITMDLNGKTFGTTTYDKSAIIVKTAGTVNPNTKVYNGTLVSGGRCLRVYEGALQMENVTAVTTETVCTIDMSQTFGKWNKDNYIKDCTLVSAKAFVLSYGHNEKDSSSVNLQIENTTIMTPNTKYNAFGNGTNTVTGTYTLGKGVKIYSPRASYASTTNMPKVGGEKLTQSAKGTAEFKLEAHNISATKLNLWETAAWDGKSIIETSGSTAPEAPTEPIAEVINGTDVFQACTPEEIKAFVSEEGTTVVKMLRDYEYAEGSFLTGLYPFTLDLNGKTVRAKGGVVSCTKPGTKNNVLTVKNGTIIGGDHGLSTRAGLLVENATIVGGASSAVGIYHTDGTYNDILRITNSTLIGTAWVPIAFNNAEPQNGIAVTVDNSTLVSNNTHKDNALISTRKEGGEIVFGANVTLLGKVENYKEDAVAESGMIVAQTGKGTASYTNSALNMKYSGLNEWKTEAQQDFADVAKDFWGYAAIMNAARAGLVKGKSQNADGSMNYVPNASMTRAEFITVICRYFYADEAASVQSGAKWWTGYYALALEKGILTTDDLDYGDLDKAMTREEMALVLSRTAPKQAAFASVVPAAETVIPDVASVGAYYKEAVLWAYGAKLLKGVDTAGTFNPKGELNRAAVATIFNTLLQSK